MNMFTYLSTKAFHLIVQNPTFKSLNVKLKTWTDMMTTVGASFWPPFTIMNVRVLSNNKWWHGSICSSSEIVMKDLNGHDDNCETISTPIHHHERECLWQTYYGIVKKHVQMCSMSWYRFYFFLQLL